ncbi:DNA polymerase III subunit delta [uncultured Helicobacter sp.]|uniref:DNA polymerase III subunit delta n=1 Tax=uncultured Helicobacter sp. TaxID=175537 RepID=UPI0026160C6C|nr:DNA polymerase III subunit delta [uncultured Helicobacter sp.]
MQQKESLCQSKISPSAQEEIMYKKELETKLTNKAEIRAILLYGEEIFLIGYYGEKIAQSLLAKGCEKNSFYFSEFDFQSALECFSQGSLFGDEALVWIKIDKKIPKKQLDSLINSLLKNGFGYLIIEFYQAENKSISEYMADARAMASSFSPSLAKSGIFEVRFFTPNLNEAMMILKEYAQNLKIQISDFNLRKILELQNFDLGLSIAELKKFAIFDQEINAEIVEGLGFSLGSVKLEEILESLLLKKPYFDKLSHFLEQGFEEVALINEVQKYFFVLFLFSSHIRIYGEATSQEVLGYKLPPLLLEQKKHFAILLRESQFESIFYVLNAWREDSLKGANKGNGFLNTLIKIQAILR